jgi:hypothetical protein
VRKGAELAEIVRQHRQRYEQTYRVGRTPDQARVLDAIQNCRTSALGGHLESCGDCGHQRNAYNSCRNRHCPKCQRSARDRWLKARQAELLPTPYYHVVFTIPHCLADVALQNRKVVYDILFRAASQTLLAVGATKRHLGAKMGFLMVLHTWGQNLNHHPHLHSVVPAGGVGSDDKWVSCKSEKILLPVRVLSRLFRGKFLHLLRRAYSRGLLRFHGSLADLQHPEGFAITLRAAVRTEWVVYSKRPFGGPEQVLAYLGRYTHRVAISNQRLVDTQNGAVGFRWKDYRTGQSDKIMRLDGVEFLRRFMLHTLPRGFVRIRHFGFLASGLRKKTIATVRRSLCPQGSSPAPAVPAATEDEAPPPLACAACKNVARMSLTTILRPNPLCPDSS